MGTRFLSAEECSIHPPYKEKILKANDLCTMVTGKRLVHPVRSLHRSPGTMPKPSTAAWTTRPLEALGSGALRKAVVEGRSGGGDASSPARWPPWWLVQPAADIVREVMEGAEPVLKATKWVKIAFVFAGQGGQYPRHGPGGWPSAPRQRPRCSSSWTPCAPGTSQQCFSGTEAELKETRNTPAPACSPWSWPPPPPGGKGLRADLAAGFSLGRSAL